MGKTIEENIHNKERRVLEDKSPSLWDIDPRNWLKPYRKTNVIYLLRMGLFYHFLGLILIFLGSNLAAFVISDYETPQIPVSISLALTSGIFEESVFFGIPFYLSGNPLVVLGTGIIWSAAHLFNTGVISIETLSYGGFLFSIPHVFFSLRTWITGKGWFTIVFHSGWNISFLMIYCHLGLRECSVINEGLFDSLNIMMAIATVFIVYMAYMNKEKKKYVNRLIFLIPVAILLIGLFLLFYDGFKFL